MYSKKTQIVTVDEHTSDFPDLRNEIKLRSKMCFDRMHFLTVQYNLKAFRLDGFAGTVTVASPTPPRML